MKRSKSIVASTVITGALALQGNIAEAQGNSHQRIESAEAIRPFRVNVSGADLKDLRRRIQSTRWPDKETVAPRRHM